MSFTGALERALEEQRRNYVRWVDSVIMSHKAYTVEKFRLFFNLTKLHQQRIDEWLRHALARKVRTLELDLTNDCCRKGREYYQCYTFPYELLRDDSVDFKFLEKLCTHYVNVKCEAVEFFLRNCPRLEHLSICRSGGLKTLKVIRPFPALKRVEISLCHADAFFIETDAVLDHPPSAVLQNAIAAVTPTGEIHLLTGLPTAEVPIYMNMYFSEVTQLDTTETRSVQVLVNGAPLFDSPILPPYANCKEMYISNLTASSDTTFALVPTSDSMLPPLINAMEVYSIGMF
ncbi:probable LRR receptor-like serine/threonine-protein kinase at1g51860 [Phtheirospermum japonicum]|uniref:Probable LRR receptor-like serine/threonine-protein kinase at1g51860 n=1 Tax=Phtheirospermum japonicum TaxID=374723 RepID=A0A830D5V6_9LAMI|nr:probable LRR receptor-like serine/threonine-protein kinase at1g51860 [Phtheirospermum japonicum]